MCYCAHRYLDFLCGNKDANISPFNVYKYKHTEFKNSEGKLRYLRIRKQISINDDGTDGDEEPGVSVGVRPTRHI